MLRRGQRACRDSGPPLRYSVSHRPDFDALLQCRSSAGADDSSIARTANLRLASPYALAGAGMVLLLVLCLESYLSAIERVTFAKIVSEPLTTVSMLLTWCGVWALASRIVVSRFHFSPHAVIACGAILSFFALSTVSEWTEFLFPFIPALWIAGLFGAGLILAALVYGHLRFASTMRRRSRLLAALSVSAAVVGVSFISDYAAPEQVLQRHGVHGYRQAA